VSAPKRIRTDAADGWRARLRPAAVVLRLISQVAARSERTAMWKHLLAVAVALGLLLAAPAARADAYSFGFHYGYPHSHGWHGWHDGFHWSYWGYWPPVGYYPPPPVYYYAPPSQPYCVQDQVYRYLPDGRIQWGTRTRCY
jgi:hypothetical protein